MLIDRFLEDAIEVDVDAVRDSSGEVLIAGITPGELSAGQAGRHAWNVVEVPPHLLDGLLDVEIGLDQHGASSLTYAVGSFSNFRRQPVQQK